MNKLIKQALDSIPIENFFITKEDYEGECVVYNYVSTPGFYADNAKKGDKYTILVNIYCKSDVEITKTKVIKAMNNFGIKGEISERAFRENGLFNIPIKFKGYKGV